MSKKIFENTFTIMTKEEDVKSLSHHTIPNTCVLEITHPFPGYYLNNFITSETKPQTLLIMLKKEVSLEYFYRKLSRIKKYTEFSFNGDLAELNLNNRKFHAIRISDLESYDQIIDLEHYFLDEGFSIRKSQTIDTKAIISVNKFSNLRFEHGIYYSLDDTHFMYFGVNKEITWKMFEHITIKIRHNFIAKKFDAGLGILFHDNTVEDVIRIYNRDLTEDDATKLREMYVKELKDY